MEKFKIYRIHFIYTIGILILTIIGLMTVKWCQIPKLVEYISFALTLTSLTLSLLAIIYSFVSNGRLSESIGSLNSVIKDVLITSEKLSDVTNSLNQKVDIIPESLKSMEEKLFLNNKIISNIKKDDNENNLENSETVVIREPIANYENTEGLININIESFLNLTSFEGKLLLYACSISLEYKKLFSINALFKNSDEYVQGFLIACESIGFIKCSKSNDTLIVTELNETINTNIERIIKHHAVEYDKDKDQNFLNKHSWQSSIQAIDDYFQL